MIELLNNRAHLKISRAVRCNIATPSRGILSFSRLAAQIEASSLLPTFNWKSAIVTLAPARASFVAKASTIPQALCVMITDFQLVEEWHSSAIMLLSGVTT